MLTSLLKELKRRLVIERVRKIVELQYRRRDIKKELKGIEKMIPHHAKHIRFLHEDFEKIEKGKLELSDWLLHRNQSDHMVRPIALKTEDAKFLAEIMGDVE